MRDLTGDVFVLTFALLFMLILGYQGCTCAGIGNVAKANKPYAGSTTATTPYVKTGRVLLRRIRCLDVECTYHVGLHPYLHNPTGMVLLLENMVCTYYLNGNMLGQSHRAHDVRVTARSSRRLEGFDFFFDAQTDKAVAVSVTCTANFGIGFPVSTNAQQL